MDDRVGTVALQKLLLDQVDVRDLRGELLDVAVVLDIDAIGHHHVGDRLGGFDALDGHLQFHFAVLHAAPPCPSTLMFNYTTKPPP